MEKQKQRCDWCSEDPVYQDYHDHEWGRPLHDDQRLFEMLILEGAQAGLSWITVLKRREGYRKAFDNFEVKKVSQYDDKKVESLIQNKSIIRNKLKIKSAIKNAQVFIKIQKEFGSFDQYIWAFVEFESIKNNFENSAELPAKTVLSDTISKDLKSRGMSFVGSTIIYAYLQACGLVNDHGQNCFLYES